MPLRSLAQARWMFATHPTMAHQWAAETPAGTKLPEHVDHDDTHQKKRFPGILSTLGK